MKVILLALLGALSAQAQSPSRGSPQQNLSRYLCSLRTDQIEAESTRSIEALKSNCPSCTAEGLASVVRAYHPATQASASAANTSEQGLKRVNQEAIPDLGGEEKWVGATLETREHYHRSFESQRCPAPVARFSKGDLKLSFIATVYVRNNPAERTEVFRAFKNEFESMDPKTVVVEGYPQDFPCSEAVRIYLAPESDLSAEPEYLAQLALRKGIPVVGGEPDGNGLLTPDREGFALLQSMSQVKEEPEKAFKEISTRVRINWDYSKFKDWYRATNKREFKLENAYADITPASSSSVAPLTTNRMSDQACLFRDQNVLKTIRSKLLLRGNVLVAYGRNHFPRQLSVYDSVFGKQAAPVAKCENLPSPSQTDSPQSSDRSFKALKEPVHPTDQPQVPTRSAGTAK